MLDFLSHGLLNLPWWGVLLCALAFTQTTIAAVTLYLHRSQAHRGVDFHPLVSHFFRFWLWLTTGMVTKEWVAIHRKHHARCETEADPHSPQVLGLKKVLAEGSELYRAAAKDEAMLVQFGKGTPDDWIERNVYTRHSTVGITIMFIVNVLLFGVIGIAIWAVQMAWIPIWAAGVINGLGHYFGYRNFENEDASTNLIPWGFWIGGEELHNNHHTYPTAAKFSVKPYEFDIGWAYIRLMQAIGWARVKKVPPRLQLGDVKPVADEKTLEALIAHRYEVMASYARGVRQACKAEMAALRARQADASVLKAARRWLHRDAEKVPAIALPQLVQARAASPVLDKMITMREELRQLWLNTSHSREQLTADLQAWCRRAEDSGIAALRDFSMRLRAAQP